MGWSCGLEAGQTKDKWTEACIAQTGQQNVFRVSASEFFWDISRTEHDDGAITGSIWLMLPENRARRVSTFRIDGDGSVARAPKFLREAAR